MNPSKFNPYRIHNSFRCYLCNLLMLFCLTTAAGPAQDGLWEAISPGFSPQALLNHQGLMWTAGSGGSIATSADGGKTWKLKHADPRDGLLLSLGFTTDKFGYAAGTGKRIVLTEDGGETWSKVIDAPTSVWQTAFGDALHGVVRTRERLISTADGGKSWNELSVLNDQGWEDKFPDTIGMTAIDGLHMIVRVSEGESGDGEFLWTRDGGATWNANYLPNGAGGGDVFSFDLAYWSIGGEVVGKDKPGGGGRIPMAVRSNDGIAWEHLPAFYDACHWSGCGGCTSQGCFAGGSSFVPFSRILQDSVKQSNPDAVEPLERFPRHILSSQWARSGETLCVLTNGIIDCALMKSVEKLDTQDDLAEWVDERFPPLRNVRSPVLGSTTIEPALKQGVRCIRCDLVNLYISRGRKSGPAELLLRFTITEVGGVRDLDVSGEVPHDVADRVRSTAQGWLFEPYTSEGKPKPLKVSIKGRVMIMNPDNR